LKIATEYIFYWTAWAFSFLTALAYLASAYVGQRLPCGHFWIGFLTRTNGLLRMGFFSVLTTDGREPMFGFTIEVLWFGSPKNVFFVQYLAPPPEPLMPMIPMTPNSTVTSASEAARQEHEQSDKIGTPVRDAMMLLSSVSILLEMCQANHWTTLDSLSVGIFRL
jgi:hypothetical protein